MKEPVRIAITGASGNIGYAMVFRIAAGDLLGPNQPVILQLLELPRSQERLQGTVMELNDGAFPLLKDVIATDDMEVAFNNAQYIFLVGSRPRGPGMERSDLLEANGAIFGPQGRAINDFADKDVKVLIIGNPANSNCLIAMHAAPDLRPQQFSAMTRLDHNRAKHALAKKFATTASEVKNVIIWGNHSATQVPDISHAQVQGKQVNTIAKSQWYEDTFIPEIQQRGAKIIEKRGMSSAASAASAALDQMRDWALGTKEGEWVSMAVAADGAYGIKEDIVFSFPVICKDGGYEIVKDLSISESIQEKLDRTKKELIDERRAIQHFLN